MYLSNIIISVIAPLLLAPFAHAQANDPWANFDSNIKACTVINKVYDVLPPKNQDALLTFCNSFVGYSTTTVTGQTDVWVTASTPLKTITVTAKPRRRYIAHAEDKLHNSDVQSPSPAHKRVTPTFSASTITPPPRIPIEAHQELKRANSKLPTPAVFKNQASLFIRTGCACLGFSSQFTIPIYTTTTATSTVPASCALATGSAYHILAYSPASAVAAAYEYGWFYYFESSPDPVSECCKDCQGRGGCVQFVYEALDPAQGLGYAKCMFLYFDNYDGNTMTGVPRLVNEKTMSCPNGYLAVNKLVPDRSSTTISSATFLGPCAVSTVTAKR